PEQAKAEGAVDVRADIYSLGATLFELVAGRPPHVGPTAIATLARLVTTPAPRLCELAPDVPASLDELVARMLSTDPAGRPATAREVVHALDAILAEADSGQLSRPRPSPRRSAPPTVQGTRLVTSIVSLGIAAGEPRAQALNALKGRGADAV